ncbi:Hypoxia up-regulated protein 1 [Tolypocladium paradoxum]|uniref:Hypoxia up-regulated protein 1 n=1 Tax=Tolypocladium paradoxum TaxID=94208 RepID=A0A2S4KNH1_9HYPO|nr:Hypoxia up-regulated protein 1 [Tolypocladium paradoxum]
MAISRRPSPLTMLLGAVFFLSANVFAAAAVLGVDLGTEYIKAALVKPGIPLEIVLTKDSRRKETSAVAFKPSKAAPKQGQFPERLYGADAMAIAARFPGEVYPNLKTLLGLPIDDAVVQEYAARHPALQLTAHGSRRTAAFKSDTLTPQEEAWTVEELLAMELQSVQKNAELLAGDGSSVRSIVLTVPPFYTTEEKRAIQTAAELAGLKVLSLVSDGLAVGLNYATSRQFPNINEGAKPEYHMVFDMGAGSTIATVMRFQSRTVKDIGKFNKTVQEVQVIGSGWDRTLGGDSLNYLIMDDMVSQFVESKGAKKIAATAEGVKSHGRAMAKISKEAERIRHVLSANQNTQASFEGLYEDVDFKYKITRADFETMAEVHAGRVGIAIDDAIKASGIDMGDLTSIILHGGASRTPFVQKALEKVVGSSDKVRSNVNADEAAVFGAGFRAAELSPSFRVKEIRISEGPMYQSGLKWMTSNEKPQRQRLWTATSPMGGPPKEMTFTEPNDFSATFYQQVGSEDREIKSIATKNLTATIAAMKERHPSCVETDIAFKLAVRLSSDNGEVQVVKAAVECEAEVSEKDGFVDGVKNLFGFGKKDQKPLKGEEEGSETQSSEGSEEVLKGDAKSYAASSSTDATESPAPSETEKTASEPSGEPKPELKKREIVSIPVEFTLEKAGVPPLPKVELIKVKDRLKAFAASDKARFQREEALNQLEAFTYKVRDLLEGETFVSRSTEKEQTQLAEKASEISDWLYEDGAEATTEEFKAKLKALQDLVAPIQTRVEEAAKRPELVSSLRDVLNQTTHFVNGLRKQIAEFDELQASLAAAISAGSSATSTASSETPTGDFDGLEDDDSNTKTGEKESDAKKETGPAPPLYKKEDVDELDALYKSTLEWLSDIESRQDGLPLTADPVLLSKDIMAKRQKVERAGMDLALKAVRNMESKAKKPSKSAGGKKKSKTKSAEDPNGTVKFSDGSGRLSDEELEQMMDQIRKMEAEKKKQKEGGEGGKQKHDEL